MVIENPVGGSPKDPYEDYRKRKEQEREQSKHSYFSLAQVMLWMRKTINYFFSESAPKAHPNANETLQEFKKLFNLLKQEDRSQDIDFSNNLSTCWNQILVHSRAIQSHALRSFIKEIQSYPKGEEHTLGYYLTEYAGQNWLPFPYIELLKTLHTTHLQTPTTSTLTRWTRELDQLIQPSN